MFINIKQKYLQWNKIASYYHKYPFKKYQMKSSSIF